MCIVKSKKLSLSHEDNRNMSLYKTMINIQCTFYHVTLDVNGHFHRMLLWVWGQAKQSQFYVTLMQSNLNWMCLWPSAIIIWCHVDPQQSQCEVTLTLSHHHLMSHRPTAISMWRDSNPQPSSFDVTPTHSNLNVKWL